MTSSKRRKPRPTQLKIRAVPLVRMPKSRFFELIRDACKNGVIPKDIRMESLNWDHKVGRSWNAGTVLSAADADELRQCYAYLTGAVGKRDVRVESPR